LKKKGGESCWIRMQKKSMNVSGRLMAIVSTYTDITVFKDTEEKLKAADQELNTFVYKASHDLKGPIASIMGLLDLASLEIKDSHALKFFDLIRQSSFRLDTILVELLDTMRIKESDVRYESIDILAVITEIITDLSHLKGMDQMHLRLNMDE